MINHFLFIFIFALFFIACSEEKVKIISNTPSNLPDNNYKLNLQSDSGEKLNSVTISWNETNGEVDLDDSGTAVTSTENSHTFSGMTPGEFRDISIQVNAGELTYEDSIQIFTRPIYPVTNFVFKVKSISTENGQKHLRSLSWSPTKELQENFSKYIIYQKKKI